MYQLDAFLQSNPADQDITNIYKVSDSDSDDDNDSDNDDDYYQDQLGIKTVKHEELASPRYTTSVPSSLAA